MLSILGEILEAVLEAALEALVRRWRRKRREAGKDRGIEPAEALPKEYENLHGSRKGPVNRKRC